MSSMMDQLSRCSTMQSQARGAIEAAKKNEGDKARADRYEKALRAMLELPLPDRVSHVYIGMIRDALSPPA